jgi:hypothetical protein
MPTDRMCEQPGRGVVRHTSPYSKPADQFCVPGQTFCDSFDQAHWLGFSPLQIKSVTLAGGSSARTGAGHSGPTAPTATPC